MTERCIEGTLFRHRPFPDDPDFEYAVGTCPACGGEGCRPDDGRDAMQAQTNERLRTWTPGKRRQKAPEGECRTCDEQRAKNDDSHPPHDASDRCESGKHTHCSCDTCY